MSEVLIVDYGMGNLRSVYNSCRHLGFHPTVTGDPNEVRSARKTILPGVGAFCEAMENLQKSGLDEALQRSRAEGSSILGICLGMQLMCTRSEEHGDHAGLGWFEADVVKFEAESESIKVPHMGWNSLHFDRSHPVTEGIENGLDAYFLHSYHVVCRDIADVVATSEHGHPFHSMVARDRIVGMQFHPEKSQYVGLKLLGNFLQC